MGPAPLPGRYVVVRGRRNRTSGKATAVSPAVRGRRLDFRHHYGMPACEVATICGCRGCPSCPGTPITGLRPDRWGGGRCHAAGRPGVDGGDWHRRWVPSAWSPRRRQMTSGSRTPASTARRPRTRVWSSTITPLGGLEIAPLVGRSGPADGGIGLTALPLNHRRARSAATRFRSTLRWACRFQAEGFHRRGGLRCRSTTVRFGAARPHER